MGAITEKRICADCGQERLAYCYWLKKINDDGQPVVIDSLVCVYCRHRPKIPKRCELCDVMKSGHDFASGSEICRACVEWKNEFNKKKAAARLQRLKPEERMVEYARRRAEANGWEFTITAADVVIPKFCRVNGLKLTMPGNGPVLDSTATIDRVNNKRGYTPDNIEVVSMKANRMKSDHDLDTLKEVADYIVSHK